MSKLNILEIMALLPHHYPLILVDKVMDYANVGSTKWIRYLKNVTINESFFRKKFTKLSTTTLIKNQVIATSNIMLMQ